MFRQLLLTFALLLLASALHAQPFLEFIGGPPSVNRYDGLYRHRSSSDYLAIGDTLLVASYGRDSVTYLRSTDDGVTWSASHLSMIYAPDGPWEFLRATKSGLLLKVRNFSSARIWTSSDGGWNWRLVRTPPINYIYDVTVGQNDTIFVSARSSLSGVRSLYRSTDMGETWTTLAIPAEGNYIWRAAQNGGRTVALVWLADSTGFYQLHPYLSDDGGESWRYFKTDQGDSMGNVAILYGDIVIDSSGTTFLVTFRQGVYRLGRNDTAWTSAGNGLPSNTLFVSLVLDGKGRLFVGTDGIGVYTSTDGGIRWQETSRTEINAWVPSLGAIGSTVFANAFQRLYRLEENGTEWRRCVTTGGPASNVSHLVIPGGSEIYAGDVKGNISKSTDNGMSWTDCTRPSNYNIFVGMMGIDSAGRLFVTLWHESGGGGTGMHRSIDHGETWTQLNQGLVDAHPSEFAFTDAGIFLGTFGEGVLRSTNGGDTWTHAGPGIPAEEIQMMFATREGVVFAGTSYNGLWRSTDDGESWQDVNNGLDHPQIWWLSESYTTGTLFLTTAHPAENIVRDATSYRSIDGGENWSKITGIIDPTPASDSLFDIRGVRCNRSGAVFALARGLDRESRQTYGRLFRSLDDGITWSPIDSLGIAAAWMEFTPDDQMFIPAERGIYRSIASTRLSVSVPRPQAEMPQMSIRSSLPGSALSVDYRLPSGGPVRLVVYDALGRELRTLLDTPQQPGEHQLNIDPTDLPSGIYYLRLTTSTGTLTRSLVLLR